MKLGDITRQLGFTNLTPQVAADDRTVSAGYASDLLSDVLAHAPRGGLLVTVQIHLNVIAVAVTAELAAVVFASNRRPEPDVVQKASEEGVALYVSAAPTFEVVGKLYGLGLRGPGA